MRGRSLWGAVFAMIPALCGALRFWIVLPGQRQTMALSFLVFDYALVFILLGTIGDLLICCPWFIVYFSVVGAWFDRDFVSVSAGSCQS